MSQVTGHVQGNVGWASNLGRTLGSRWGGGRWGRPCLLGGSCPFQDWLLQAVCSDVLPESVSRPGEPAPATGRLGLPCPEGLTLGCVFRLPSPENWPSSHPDWGPLSRTPGLRLRPRRKLGGWELRRTLKGETPARPTPRRPPPPPAPHRAGTRRLMVSRTPSLDSAPGKLPCAAALTGAACPGPSSWMTATRAEPESAVSSGRERSLNRRKTQANSGELSA